MQRLGDAGREAPDEAEANVVAQGHPLRPQPGKGEVGPKENHVSDGDGKCCGRCDVNMNRQLL